MTGQVPECHLKEAVIATSQNGWPAGERADVGLVNINVPGTKTKIPVKGGDVATVLLWIATRWHNEVEPLVEPGNWGYAYRAIRGATSGLSNHASGTAIDLNAPAHPLATAPLATLSKAQVAAAKRIEADTNGVVRWGGSYTGRADTMHWEINAGSAAVAALARRIDGGNVPSPTTSDEELTVAQYDNLVALVQQQHQDMAKLNYEILGQVRKLLDRIEATFPEGSDRLRDLWNREGDILDAVNGDDAAS